MFDPQARTSVPEMAGLTAKSPPAFQKISFPRGTGSRDTLPTHGMAVLGTSSSSWPVVDAKPPKNELEEGEEGEVVEDTIEPPVSSWGNAKEEPVASEFSFVPCGLLVD